MPEAPIAIRARAETTINPDPVLPAATPPVGVVDTLPVPADTPPAGVDGVGEGVGVVVALAKFTAAEITLPVPGHTAVRVAGPVDKLEPKLTFPEKLPPRPVVVVLPTVVTFPFWFKVNDTGLFAAFVPQTPL